MLGKLELLREEINKMMESGDYDKNDLIKKSEELDKYIINFMKDNILNHKETLEE